MAGLLDGVTIKKEIEDPLDSPENADTQDSGQGQTEGQSNQKLTKVWCEEETRSLIELAKVYIPKFKDSSYSKRNLLEDISNELQMMGYETTPEHVRNKMKYLRTRYKNFLDYNSRHSEKRSMPFSEELAELYRLDYFEDQDFYSAADRNGSSDFTFKAGTKKNSKSTIPASHVDLRTVVTSKRKAATQVIHKGTKFTVKKKNTTKGRSQPLFQCGLCMEKFKTSHDMHGHSCKTPLKSATDSGAKKKTNSTSPPTNVFHWNSLITMQFLELLKEYQQSHKNSNFRKGGNLWAQMSALMKRRGYSIHPREVEKKWHTLSSAFEKTLQYNKTHKDKKKCAFFKRLTELHRHPSSFHCFRTEEPVKMTVEVSPFSFAACREQPEQAGARPSPSAAQQRKGSSNGEEQKPVPPALPPHPNGMGELLLWLDSTWTEWKELEKKREALQAQRHNELMEMMSYLVESSGNNGVR